ncbi:hypothetical protein LCGC14_0374180 [marine sediment metagenome]|uniref:AMP-dependent synthetase/ligase domain-containing protein n=1 Tax=marine sediment metagenome TaxID=412755 RepID=A0A0F9WCV0_9ZZZZ
MKYSKLFWFVELKEIEDYYNRLKKGETIEIKEFSGKTKELCTSGSTTGKPKYVTVNKEQLELRFAAEWYTMELTGWKRGERWVHLWYPLVREHKDSKSNKEKLSLKRKYENCLFLSYFNLNDNMMKDYYYKIKKFKPKLLVSYSEAVWIFANFLDKNNLRLNIPYVISSGGHLYPEWRKVIEKTMNSKVFNRLGCSEFGVIAQEDRKGNMRIVSQRGLSVKKGNNNELLITDINNKAIVFKDYNLGDTGKIKDDIITDLKGKIKSGKSYLRIFQNTIEKTELICIRCNGIVDVDKNKGTLANPLCGKCLKERDEKQNN